VDHDDLVTRRVSAEHELHGVARDTAAQLHENSCHVVYSAFRRT
jgi:hypothetical protein